MAKSSTNPALSLFGRFARHSMGAGRIATAKSVAEFNAPDARINAGELTHIVLCISSTQYARIGVHRRIKATHEEKLHSAVQTIRK